MNGMGNVPLAMGTENQAMPYFEGPKILFMEDQ
jgi:hypothetical protein